MNSTNENASKPQQKDNTMNNNNRITADGFVGVERSRNRTKRIFLSGIASSVNEKHIQSYLERRNINPIYISVFPSKRKGTVLAKVHIPFVDLPLVQDDDFWPRLVICKLWQSKESLGKQLSLSHRPTHRPKHPKVKTSHHMYNGSHPS